MDQKELHSFANDMIALGRAHGFILGMKRANEILRAHGIDPVHPARAQLFDEMMTSNQAGVTAYAAGALNASPQKELA
jgi:hypothetical protein